MACSLPELILKFFHFSFLQDMLEGCPLPTKSRTMIEVSFKRLQALVDQCDLTLIQSQSAANGCN